MRQSLKNLVGSVGLRVEAFASAQEFLRSKVIDVPGCLVLDVRLPGLSGLDLQKRMADAGIAIPIIFITGHGDIPMTVRAMKAGAVEFLTKPFRDQDLLDAIQQALERDRIAREQRAEIEELRGRFDFADAARARGDGTGGCRAAQQADSRRAGHERDYDQDSPPSGDGKDGSRLPGGTGSNGRPARHPYPKVVAALTKVQ